MGIEYSAPHIDREGGERIAQRTHCREAEAGYDMLADGTTGETQYSETVSLKLYQLKQQARENPTRVFTSIHHLIDVPFLQEAYRRTNKSAAAGVDEVTALDYAENLDANLISLYKRYRSGNYKAPAVKRVWIEKEDGTQRPLGMPAFEDKILQRAIAMLLSAIYEVDFHFFSLGFREKRSPHMALKYLRDSCYRERASVIIDADVSKFFDNMSHTHIREIIKLRVNDGKVIRFIGKWLNAGVVENDNISYPSCGSPQGGCISPLIANIYLHHVLDEWYVQEVKPRLLGKSFIVRFADDFVIGCENPSDGERLMKVLVKRFERFNLTIHPEKSKKIQFSHPSRTRGENQTGTFDFLGFTHYWGKTRSGGWAIKRKTAKKKMRRAMRNLWTYCRNFKHEPLEVQSKDLRAKLLGLYHYYGIIGNYKMLEVLYEHALFAWKRWLGRRTRDGYITHERFKLLTDRWCLPLPRIMKQV